ncbi:hypothetical protein [Acaryochloris sp. IP29b_bin.148]|uniref:hypothetical protein n=1 Tax=Acaryochloris sp. IP29b_bin.148 TaxID=2969218 RepID=UPI00261878BB|nr:hypothetical protein [Acaryochloris sp. IP29b_bin.148]
MNPKRILSTALLSLSVLTVGISEAKAAEIGVSSDLQESQLVSLKFKKFGHRRHGFHGRRRFRRRHHGRRRFRRFHHSPSFGFKKFKVLKKKHHDKHHDYKFHHDHKDFHR